MTAPQQFGDDGDDAVAEIDAEDARAMVRRMVEAFVAELRRDAGDAGALSLDDIGHAVERFVASSAAPAVLARDIGRLLDQQRVAIWDRSRNRPFERLLINRVSGLFPKEGGSGGGAPLSRRVIPGVLDAVEMMVGADELAERRRQCKRLLNAVRTEQGGVCDWHAFGSHDEPGLLIDDTLVAMGRHFDPFERRLEWLLERINDRLAPAEDVAFEGPGAADWRLDRRGLVLMLRALYAPFVPRLRDTSGRMALMARYGGDRLARIESLIDALTGHAAAG